MPSCICWCLRRLVRCGMPLRPASHKVFGGTWGGTTIIGGTAKKELTASEGRALATSNSSGDQFVGRGEVLASLSELLTSSKESNQAAYIVGEAGVGKTRLVEVVAEAAREANFRVIWGRPQQYAEDFPYLAFLQITNQLKGGSGSNGSTLLPEAATTEWASLSVDTRAARTRFILNIANAVIQQAEANPTMIVMDDLQWADIASLLLLSNLLDLPGRGLFFVCLSRPENASRPQVEGLLKAIRAGSRVFELAGLDQVELHELTATILGEGVLSESEVASLWGWTNGNPLFVKTLVAHLKETGLLEEHGLDEALRRSDMPSGASQAIRARIEDLGPRIRHVLSVAAVLGDEFDRAALADILEEAEDSVAGQLGVACERDIIAADSGLRDDRLRFRHPLYRKTLYELLPPSERRGVHKRIAQLAADGRLQLSPEELATHAWSKTSGVNEDAARHCQAAARHAEGLLAYESAARFWEMALDCVDLYDASARAEVLKRQGWALWAANSWKRCEEVWCEAIALYEVLDESLEIAKLSQAIGDMMRWRQDATGAEQWTKRALLGLPKDSLDRARALAILGSVQSQRGPATEGLSTLQEAIRATDAVGSSDPRIDFWLSYGLRRAGDSVMARKIAERGLLQAESANDSHGTVMLAGTLARTELAGLNPAAAGAYISRMNAAAGHADTASILMLLEVQAYYLGYVGDWLRLTELCETTMAKLRLAGSYQVASARVLWAEAQFALSRWDLAAETMRGALPHLAEMQDMCRIHIARVLASSGNGAGAIQAVEGFLETALQSDGVRSGMAVVADAAAALEPPELWQPAYDLLAKEPGAIAFVYSPTSVSRVRGRLATRLKKWTDAVDHFDAATAHLAEGGATWELMRTYQDYAVMRRARGRRGDSGKAEALEMKAAQLLESTGLGATPTHVPYVTELRGNEYGLTGREVEVLQLVARGLRNKEIAEELSLSPHTVERHLENIYGKMDATGRADAVIRAVESGVLTRTRQSP